MTALLARLPDWVWLVPVLPLLAVIANAARVLLGRAQGDGAEPLTVRLTTLATFASFVLLLAIDAVALWRGWPGHRVAAVWFGTAEWQVTFSFLLDAVSLPVATVTALIGWLVARFSANYLHREAGFHRFYIVLGFFIAGIELVLLAGNGLLCFVGWEMCGVASFLLIGYAWQRPVATGNALYAFVTNRVGDAGLLFSLGLSVAWVGSFEWPVLAGGAHLSMVEARILALGFVAAAMVKSAQAPFTPWITRALEGPTPSSAIFYGAVLIHAGVYLMLRLYPLLSQVPDVMAGLVVVGVLTALYAWLCGLVQTDVKSALIHGTVTQVALMFVEIGLGWTTLATFHLCLHAGWRAWQFLLAPSWLMLTRDRPEPPPAWLVNNQWLYTAALQRFWLDRLAVILFVLPTEAIARDVRSFEQHFVDPLIGRPGEGQAVDAQRPLVQADGLPGRALAQLADLLQRLENRLLLRGRGGSAERLMRQAGSYLHTLENLLEQPRYLMMAVMATFVVIL